jgi:hypothetical protein
MMWLLLGSVEDTKTTLAEAADTTLLVPHPSWEPGLDAGERLMMSLGPLQEATVDSACLSESLP